MTNKKIISLNHNELVSLVESVVMDVREQTSSETKKHKTILKNLPWYAFGLGGVKSIYDFLVPEQEEDEDGPSGEAGEMNLSLVLEDGIWDKIWYGARDVLGWISLVSVIPHPVTRIVGLVAGGLAGAMHMVDDEWGTGVAYWIFEALPYIKLGKFMKVSIPNWAKIHKLKPREVRRAMEVIAAGGDIAKVKGGAKIQQLLVREGPELIETYTKAMKTTKYKHLKKLAGKLTTPKLYDDYIKSGAKHADALKEIPYSKWSEVVTIIKATGPMELKGLKLLVARALSVSHTATIGLTYYAIASIAQKITDIQVVKRRINTTINPWESALQGKEVYYDYNDIMLNNIEFLHENPVLLLKAWGDADQFPPLSMTPVDVTISGEEYWGMGPDGKDSEYYYGNDNYGALWGPGAGKEKLKNPEKPYNRITYPANPGGWRPELGIWRPDEYDLRFMDAYFRESLEAIKSIFELLDQGKISEDEARNQVEKTLNIDLD
jgi:hypothetical protein